MVTNLSLGSRRKLDSQGFELTHRIGFDSQKVPLFTHKKVIGKGVGDVLLHFTLQNPNQLNEGESTYLQRKARQGIFPWKPGAECLRREMKDIEVTKDALTGRDEVRVTESRYGCPWCRKNMESQGEASPPIVPVENEPSSAVESPPPVTAPITCPVLGCGYIGKGSTPKRQANAVRLHKRARHK